MTRVKLFKKIYEKTGIPHRIAGVIVEHLIYEILKELKENEKCEIDGFGSFYIVKRRAGRSYKDMYRNIMVDIPAYKALVFHSVPPVAEYLGVKHTRPRLTLKKRKKDLVEEQATPLENSAETT